MGSPGECRSGNGESDKRGGDDRDRTRQRDDLDTLLPVTLRTVGRDRNRDWARAAHVASALIL
jgi:hypothetical protein